MEDHKIGEQLIGKNEESSGANIKVTQLKLMVCYEKSLCSFN